MQEVACVVVVEVDEINEVQPSFTIKWPTLYHSLSIVCPCCGSLWAKVSSYVLLPSGTKRMDYQARHVICNECSPVIGGSLLDWPVRWKPGGSVNAMLIGREVMMRELALTTKQTKDSSNEQCEHNDARTETYIHSA